jgi:hypothetical protein
VTKPVHLNDSSALRLAFIRGGTENYSHHDNTPAEHDNRDPDLRTVRLQHQVRWYLEQAVEDEEGD